MTTSMNDAMTTALETAKVKQAARIKRVAAAKAAKIKVAEQEAKARAKVNKANSNRTGVLGAVERAAMAYDKAQGVAVAAIVAAGGKHDDVQEAFYIGIMRAVLGVTHAQALAVLKLPGIATKELKKTQPRRRTQAEETAYSRCRKAWNRALHRAGLVSPRAKATRTGKAKTADKGTAKVGLISVTKGKDGKAREAVTRFKTAREVVDEYATMAALMFQSGEKNRDVLGNPDADVQREVIAALATFKTAIFAAKAKLAK